MQKETELYLPIKHHLESLGFTVRAEVRDCDITATKGDLLVIVELKTNFNLDLVLQGLERKRICDDVYLAIPQPKNTPRHRKILRLCTALGLGLFSVSPRGTVQVLLHPLAQSPRKQPGQKNLLIREIEGRTGDYNIGGSSGRPLVTAYRESALRIAQFIGSDETRLGDIVKATGVEKAPQILQKNYYRWFERVKRGIYRLTPDGYEALSKYKDIIN